MVQRLLGQKWRSAMSFVQTATKLELTRESKKMDLENEIREVLFEVGKDLKIHKITNDNFILEIDYEKYVRKIMQLLES